MKDINIKDLFKICCYHTRPKVYLRALRIYGKSEKLNQATFFIERNTKLTKICGHCNSEIENYHFAYISSYWVPNSWKPCHKNCTKEYLSSETYECQNLDADCNDCIHFKREKEIGKGIYKGDCLKYNKPTKAYPNTSTGNKCFEHRKKQKL